MNAWTPTPLEPLPNDAHPRAAAGERVLHERRLEILSQLAEAGLNIVLAIERQATQPNDASADTPRPDVFQGDLALAYDRVSRAVRMSLALQAKLVEDRREQWRTARQGANLGVHDRKRAIRNIVGRMAAAEHDDRKTIRRLADQSLERLEDEGLYGHVMSRPVSDILADICRDLGLRPDWADYLDEAWAREEIASGEVGEPLAEFVEPVVTPAPTPLRRAPPHRHPRA